MKNGTDKLFSPADLDRIAAAVAGAERESSGEIVPYVVAASDSYGGTIWRASALVMALTLLTLGAIPLLVDTWVAPGITMTAIITLGIGLIVWIALALIPSLRILFTDSATITRRVAARSAQAFLSREVFATRHRSGILIFLSLLEHRVIILGDSGINAVMKDEEWNGIVALITDGIRAGRPADALIDAISRCGALLRERGFAVAGDDRNELGNEMEM